jgi:hypothetical protein
MSEDKVAFTEGDSFFCHDNLNKLSGIRGLTKCEFVFELVDDASSSSSKKCTPGEKVQFAYSYNLTVKLDGSKSKI